jgi:hypothetical protein
MDFLNITWRKGIRTDIGSNHLYHGAVNFVYNAVDFLNVKTIRQ